MAAAAAISCLSIGAEAETAAAERQELYETFAPMFRYWCESAGILYTRHLLDHTQEIVRRPQAEGCEPQAAAYRLRLKAYLARDDRNEAKVVLIAGRFIGQACIDMQAIGSGRTRADGACPLADRPDNDTGARINSLEAMHPADRFSWPPMTGRDLLLSRFPLGSPAEALAAYLKAHAIECRATPARETTGYRCLGQYDEITYADSKPEFIVSSVVSVVFAADTEGKLERIDLYTRFDEGHGVFLDPEDIQKLE